MKIRETRKIYFAQAGVFGPIKIGCSACVSARMRDIGWSIGLPVRLLGTVSGGYLKEHSIQRRFKKFLIGREWYWPREELMTFISKQTKP